MVGLVRHRQTKEPATDRFHLNHRATPRLHKLTSQPFQLSSGRAPLLAPSPLRTGLEGFPSSGSSTQKRPPEKRGRGLIQKKPDLLDSDLLPSRTVEENPSAMWVAAPTGCPVVICFASFLGSS